MNKKYFIAVLLFFLTISFVESSQNLLKNHSFEDNAGIRSKEIDSWKPWGGDVYEVWEKDSYAGDVSVKFWWTGGIYQSVPVVPGDEYHLTAWFLNSSSEPLDIDGEKFAVIQLRFVSENGVVVSTKESKKFDSKREIGKWHQLEVTGAAPPNAFSVQAVIEFIGGKGKGAVCIDDVRLELSGKKEFSKKEYSKDLTGQWLFRKGSKSSWSKIDYDDSSWEKILVPERWEEEYPEYDGFGWYRFGLIIPSELKDEPLFLFLGGVDDTDETYFNGVKIGSSGRMPPGFHTAWDQKRQYDIPSDIINYGQKNIIAVKVYDKTGDGGIVREPVKIFSAASLADYFEKIAQKEKIIPVTKKELNNTDLFLERIGKAAFRYFVYEAGPTGLIQDRMTDKIMASTLGAGYQLTSWCIAAERGWVTREEAAKNVLGILKTYESLQQFHGIFGHFHNTRTQKVIAFIRKEDDGADLSETGFMMGGVLTCRTYFDHDDKVEKQIRELTTKIYEKIEWDWMLNYDKDVVKNIYDSVDHDWMVEGDPVEYIDKTLSWHWSPKYGFKIGQRISSYMELSSMMTYILAIGSPKHSIPAECWDEGWTRGYSWLEYKGNKFIRCPPLFAHQYAHSWIDFRYKKDRFADYSRNSVYATLAQREYCLETMYPKYNIWGLTFQDGPSGFGIYGYPPKQGEIDRDASIAPSACAGSIVFTPEESLSSLKYMYSNFENMVWGKYGFYGAFSPKHNWTSRDYIGIDLGCMLAMIENYRSGFVWKYVMKNEYVKNGMDKIGFAGIIDDFEVNDIVAPYSKWDDLNRRSVYKCRVSDEIVKDGKYSMEVRFGKRKKTDKGFFAKPNLTDFSDYKYISLWTFDAPELKLKLENNNGKIVELEKGGWVECSDGWNHVYYRLPSNEDIKNITRVIFAADTQENKSKGMFYMDEVLLINSLNLEKPDMVKNFTANAEYTPGEVVLKWSQPDKKPYRYIIKYSDKPINDESTFLKIKDISYIGGYKNTYTIGGLESGKTYYFAIKAENKSYNTSAVSNSIEVTTAEKFTIDPVIDNFDEGDIKLKWGGYPKGLFKYEASSEKAKEGPRSLKISYNKKGQSDVWAHMVTRINYHNFSDYKYITMWVYGKADILAKLWNWGDKQEEIATMSATDPSGWTKLTFDFSKCEAIDKNLIRRILFFIQPGKTDCSGTIYIDSIKLSNNP
ncbi:MAG: fibronectin type III domain-containing protein [Elusimicrobia bacterium]|nr:fibronectin type III domain-containing protein [Elusimicrobiota bacterium]